MYLTKLHLRNWRSYRNVSFSLPVPDRSGRRNVILIGAQNGVGKTSFLMALYLGLFGREAMNLIEGFRTGAAVDDKLLSYRRLLESILHRPEKDEEDPHCSVTLTFNVDEQEITITRKWNFRSGGRVRDLDSPDGEEVLIDMGGRKKLFSSWAEANNKISEILFPVNVMPCLFFDGEQAQARVEAAGGRALFDAVKTLYGAGILDQLSESLRTYINNERAALQRDVGAIRDDELEQKRQELDNKRDELKHLQDELALRRKDRAEAEEGRQHIENKLYAMVGDKAADVEVYSKEVAALQSEELKLQQDLVLGVGGLSLPLSVGNRGRALTSALLSEEKRAEWLVLKEAASNKATTIVDSVLPLNRPVDVSPPLSTEQRDMLRTQLEKALESLWSPPPDGCADGFRFCFLTQADRQSVLSKLERCQRSNIAGLANIAVELHAVSKRLTETRLRFERTRDIQPQLQKLKVDLQDALDRHKEISQIAAGLEHRERALHQEISDLRGAIGQMETRRDAMTPIQKKLDVAQRVRALVEDAKDQLIPLCKAALEERCTLHFRAMISGEYARFAARFDSESEPWLQGPRGQEVLVSSLSGAQKRAFGLAFTLAVADVSQSNAPIVVDTPVGNMDSEYRGRVLQYVADAAPGQVVFLSHNEEIYGQYVNKLQAKIRKQFLVTFQPVQDGAGVSGVVEDKYFG